MQPGRVLQLLYLCNVQHAKLANCEVQNIHKCRAQQKYQLQQSQIIHGQISKIQHRLHNIQQSNQQQHHIRASKTSPEEELGNDEAQAGLAKCCDE